MERRTNMQEYSRILIERYCMEHNSAKSRRLRKLVEMSYDLSAVGAFGRNPGRLCGMFSVWNDRWTEKGIFRKGLIIDLKSTMIKYNWIKGIVKAVIARSADMRRCIWREAKGNLTDKAGVSCPIGQIFVHFNYHSNRSQSTSPSCVSSHFS